MSAIAIPNALDARPAMKAGTGRGVPRRRFSTLFSRKTTSVIARFTKVVDTIPSATSPGT